MRILWFCISYICIFTYVYQFIDVIGKSYVNIGSNTGLLLGGVNSLPGFHLPDVGIDIHNGFI